MTIWTALVNIKPRHPNTVLEESLGAWIPLLARGVDARDAELKIRQHFDDHDLDVTELKSLVALDADTRPSYCDEDLLELIDSFPDSEYVRFSKMYSYEH